MIRPDTLDIDEEIINQGLADCEFLFTLDERRKYQDNNFYCFLYGRKFLGKNVQYNRCVVTWEKSKTFSRGRELIKKQLVKHTPKRSHYTSLHIRQQKLSLGYKPLEDHKGLTYRKSYVLINKVKMEVQVPIDAPELLLRPQPGLNFYKYTKKFPYKYSIGVSTYYFLWSRSHKYKDITKLLAGRDQWPIELTRIYYDRHLQYASVGDYPYLAFLIKKGYAYGTLKNHTEFLSCMMLPV